MNTVNLKTPKAFFGSLITLAMILLPNIVFGYVQENLSKVPLKSTPELVQIKPSLDDDFLLFADYYSGAKSSGGAIVLHDCNNDRRSYSLLAESIAKQGLHTLLVDLRGYGKSISEGYSHEKVKNNAKDRASYQGQMNLITIKWPEDLSAIYQFLTKKIDKSKGVAVVASGCSGAYAIKLAERIQLDSIVMITPKMTYSDKERYKNLIDMPSYFITSSNHQESFETTQELFTWNGDKRSKLQVFKGTDYDKKLIFRKKTLINDIALWVKLNPR